MFLLFLVLFCLENMGIWRESLKAAQSKDTKTESVATSTETTTQENRNREHVILFFVFAPAGLTLLISSSIFWKQIPKSCHANPTTESNLPYPIILKAVASIRIRCGWCGRLMNATDTWYAQQCSAWCVTRGKVALRISHNKNLKRFDVDYECHMNLRLLSYILFIDLLQKQLCWLLSL